MKLTITVETQNGNYAQLAERIHDCLKGNLDYVESRIVLNFHDQPDEVKIYMATDDLIIGEKDVYLGHANLVLSLFGDGRNGEKFGYIKPEKTEPEISAPIYTKSETTFNNYISGRQ